MEWAENAEEYINEFVEICDKYIKEYEPIYNLRWEYDWESNDGYSYLWMDIFIDDNVDKCIEIMNIIDDVWYKEKIIEAGFEFFAFSIFPEFD